MKKIWILLLCIALAVAMTFTFTACKKGNLTISENKITLKVGEHKLLTASEKDVEWKSSDNSVATVDAQGTVTGVKVGSAKVTATLGNLSASCNVSVIANDNNNGNGNQNGDNGNGNGGNGNGSGSGDNGNETPDVQPTAASLLKGVDFSSVNNVSVEAGMVLPDGEILLSFIALSVSEEGLNGDIVNVSLTYDEDDLPSCSASVYIMRGENLYMAEIAELSVEDDFVSAVQQYINSNPQCLQTDTLDNVVEGIMAQVDQDALQTFAMKVLEQLQAAMEQIDQEALQALADKISALLESDQYAGVEETARQMGIALIDNLINGLFNSVEATEDGYDISTDFPKIYDDGSNSIAKLIEYAESNPSIKEFYKSEQFKAVFQPVLEGISGAQMEEMLYFLDEVLDGAITKNGLDIIRAGTENAYKYLGKYINTDNLIVQSITEKPIKNVIQFVSFYLQRAMEQAEIPLDEICEIADTVVQLARGILQEFGVELHFNTDKVLEEITLTVELNVDAILGLFPEDPDGDSSDGAEEVIAMSDVDTEEDLGEETSLLDAFCFISFLADAPTLLTIPSAQTATAE